MLRKLGYVVATIIILIALLVSASRLLTPVLDKHRADIENWATQLLGAKVTIGEARVTWYQYEPGVSLNQVTVFDKDTKAPILQIKKVRIFFSIPQSIWQHKVIPSAVMVAGTSVKLIQSEKGEISLQGFPALGGFNDQPYQHQTKATDILLWLSTGPRLILRDIDVRYTGAAGQKRFVTLYNLNFINSGSIHKAYGKAILHQDIPTELTLACDWEGNVTDLSQLTVNAYVYVSGFSLSQWLAGLSWHDWQVKQGLGGAKIWVTWQNGVFQKIQGQFQLYNLLLQSAMDQSLHKITRLSGSVGWKKENGNQVIAGDDILVDLPEHLWPATDFRIELTQDEHQQWVPKKISTDYLDIKDIEEFLMSTAKLLPDASVALLKKLNLSGSLQNSTMTFPTPWNDFSKITFSTQLNRMSIAPYQTFPGVQNLSALINWNGMDGDLVLQSMQTAITYNSIFSDPLQFEQLNGEIKLQYEDSLKQWLLTIKSLRADNADLTLTVSGDLSVLPHALPTSNLKGDFILKNAKNVHLYLPSRIFDKQLNQWLSNAFLSGGVDAGKIIVSGPLADFPFDKGDGEFSVKGAVSHIDLRYAPDWPILKDVNAKLIFMGRKMEVDVDHAEMLGIPIQKVHGEIPYLGDKQPQWLNITAAPIQTDFSNGLQVIRQSPLNKTIGKMFATMDMKGPMTLGLTLAVPLKNPDDTTVRGVVDMTQTLLDLTPWNLRLSKMQGQFIFTEKGMTSNGIQGELFGKPLTLTLANMTQGKSSLVRASINTSIASSDIEKWLNISLQKIANGTANIAGTIDLSLNSPINVQLNSNLQGMALLLPDPYAKSANQKQDFILNIMAQENKPLDLNASIGKDLKLGLVMGKPDWDVSIQCPFATGRISLPANMSKSGSINAVFDRINIPESKSKDNTKWDIDANSLPSMSVVINNLRYGNLSFGRVSAQTVSSPRGLTIRSASINLPNLQMNGSGEWVKNSKGNITYFKGTAKSNNLSLLLTNWGFDMRSIVLGSGNFDFNLNWPSVPFTPSMDNLNGTASIKLGQGRIVDIGQSSNAKMDLGRMLNIFSLQSIPRRLSFDFSDVFQKGYSFDSLKGDLKFDDGDLYTSNTAFDGPVARVGIAGRIGLAEKDYDLTLNVTPYVTSSIPVAATLLTGQPVIGLAALVVNKFITPAVSTVTTYYYSVRGPWSNPSWESISVSKKKQ